MLMEVLIYALVYTVCTVLLNAVLSLSFMIDQEVFAHVYLFLSRMGQLGRRL